MTKSDYLLHISYDAADLALDELVQSRLFLTRGTGSTAREAGGTVTVSAYFDSPDDRDEAAGAMADLPVKMGTSEAERLNWLDLYQQSLQPILIGDRFVVAPDAALIEGGDRLAIVVPQEQAFGTGGHESTALCLEMLERLDVAGKSGLDVGAGSGILAIAMCRLGARKVIAFDNDPDTFAPLRGNRARNAVPAAALALFIGEVDTLRGGVFDVVTMNIQPEVIVALFGALAPHVGDTLILGGILDVRKGDVIAAASARSFRLQEERVKGEWWCGRFQRRR